jgi:hypothetical protein
MPTEPTPPRYTWAHGVANRPPEVHPAALAERLIRHKLDIRPELAGIDLRSDDVREAIRDTVGETLRFSADGSTFVALGPGGRIWDGSEDEVLRKMANSLAARIAAAAAQEQPTELTPLETVKQQQLKRPGNPYSF